MSYNKDEYNKKENNYLPLPKGYFKSECNKRGNNHLFLQIIFIVLLLQQAILRYVSNSVLSTMISSVDEICALVLFIIFCVKSFNGFKLFKEEKYIILSLVIMTLIGLTSNLYSGFQPMSYALIDVLTCSKFIFVYLGVRALYTGKISENFFYDHFNGIAKFFSVLFFLLMLHDYLLNPFFKQVDFRYFALSTELFYPHPTFLASSCIILMCILISSLNKCKTNMIYICMLATVVIMTFRSKAIAFVALFFFLMLCVMGLRIRSKFFIFLPLILSGLYIGWDQLQYYFVKIQESTRAIMLRDCFKIANKFFPLGSGFATYGSFMANEHYSPLYNTLGYSGLQGMSQNSVSFLSDSFWPIIIGQFGYFGMMCFLIIVLCFFMIGLKFQKNTCAFIALTSILLYMMISSTSESSFFNPFATIFFLIFGLIVSQNLSAKQTDLSAKQKPTQLKLVEKGE